MLKGREKKEGGNSMKVQNPFLVVVGIKQEVLHERRTSELRIQEDTPSTAKC